jgi:hypothetical protein
MASKTIARTLRIHGDFIKEIYGAVGDQPFAARRLATLGVDIPPGVCLSRFRNAGIFTLVGRSAGKKPSGDSRQTSWNSVRHRRRRRDPHFRDARRGPGTARALDSAA